MIDVDVEIRPLVNFINNLEGVTTYGSCQGHDDGGKSGKWLYPYIKFKCINNRSLGLIAGIENAYANLDDLQKLNNFNLIYSDSSAGQFLHSHQNLFNLINMNFTFVNGSFHC